MGRQNGETCAEYVPSLKIHLLTFAVQSFVGPGRTLKTEPLFTMKKTKCAAQLLVCHLFSFSFTVHHYLPSGLHKLWQPGSVAARKWRENEKMKRKWRENKKMERDWGNGERFTLYISSFSIHFLYQKLSQNVKHSTCVANVTKNLTYALWENNSWSNLLRESSAGCEGLGAIKKRQNIETFGGYPNPGPLKYFSAPRHQILAKSAPQKARNRDKSA